ncbi:unnamed protein product [Echinostoma caproni]|uniref:Uncharacterized protein n=1 Tax=Echinostoma caproni TaxID=27848 RepID=A0A183B7W8_9TREM|nr:unnamed protein product [Echinostoma caproni]
MGIHSRDQGRNRRSLPPRTNSELLKHAVAMNLLPTPSHNSSSVQNTGLGPGETWARISIVQGASYSLNLLQELINATLGTQLRFYNVCVEVQNVVMYAKIRQKQEIQFRKLLQSLRDPITGKDQLVTDLTTVPEPRVPSCPSNSTVLNIGSLFPDSWMEALRACFRERFQPTTRSLDLSSLHTEPTLLSQGLYLPLNRTSIVHAMISILKNNGAQVGPHFSCALSLTGVLSRALLDILSVFTCLCLILFILEMLWSVCRTLCYLWCPKIETKSASSSNST